MEAYKFINGSCVVFVAASLARYATPAWNRIIEAYHDDIYNDIRSAYINVSEGFALFLRMNIHFNIVMILE